MVLQFCGLQPDGTSRNSSEEELLKKNMQNLSTFPGFLSWTQTALCLEPFLVLSSRFYFKCNQVLSLRTSTRLVDQAHEQITDTSRFWRFHTETHLMRRE